jgi:ribonuclease P protein component
MRRSLTRAERVKGKSDVDRLFSSTGRIHCPGARFIYAKNQLDCNRILVSTVRKYGTAVERNRARRHGREIFRNTKELLKQGFDLAFILYPGTYGYEERRDQFFELARRAGLLV